MPCGESRAGEGVQAGKATVREKGWGQERVELQLTGHSSGGGALDILKSLSLSKINHALTQKKHTFNTELIRTQNLLECSGGTPLPNRQKGCPSVPRMGAVWGKVDHPLLTLRLTRVTTFYLTMNPGPKLPVQNPVRAVTANFGLVPASC